MNTNQMIIDLETATLEELKAAYKSLRYRARAYDQNGKPNGYNRAIYGDLALVIYREIKRY